MSKDQNPSDKACDAYFDNPYAATSGSHYSDRVTFYAGFQAGAASRDAEVARLKTVPMRYRRMAFNAQLQDEVAKLENECDQLREQIASLKDELRQISTAIDDVRLDLTNTAAELIMEMKEQLASRDAEVVSLTNQRDYEYVRAENAEQERDQLREQVKMLRDALLTCSVGDFSTGHVIHPSFDEKLVEEALSATEPKL